MHISKKGLLTAAALLLTAPLIACTNFLVGKKASADGACYISYSADSYGMFGSLEYLPAARHAPGSLRRIVDRDTHHFQGYIAEAAETYAVMGHINEHQVAVMETTFGGREELIDPHGIIDYPSLMTLALQRARTAREAIGVMTSLVQEYGYASEGESFSVADPNEAWILEMIGKGPDEKGAVWVAVRIPDDCIAAHANHSRIHRFNLKDRQNVLYAKDVISFARKKGYFSGKDEDFSFSAAYAPEDFSALRFCEARVWSFYNRFCSGMDKYLAYARGLEPGRHEPLPLYLKPDRRLSLRDVREAMRDHYEGTPFDVTCDAGAGVWTAPYRPTPLMWEHEGRKYFNERPISTQQSAYCVIAQLRSQLPDAVGGVLWFANDDAHTTPFSPVYCCATTVPEPFSEDVADDHTFSDRSAFWVCNWVANMTYPRYSQLFPSLKEARDEVDSLFATRQPDVEQEAEALIRGGHATEARRLLDTYTTRCAREMLERWKQLAYYLIVKYNDQAVKVEERGRYKLTPDSLIVAPQRPGFDPAFRSVIVRETGDRFLVPAQ
ncbi:MAG: dipeptidase [Alloprevotella sp.]